MLADIVVIPNVAIVTTSGLVATYDNAFAASIAVMTGAGFAPDIEEAMIDLTIDIPLASIVVGSDLADVEALYPVDVDPDIGSIVITGYGPDLSLINDVAIEPAWGQIATYGFVVALDGTVDVDIVPWLAMMTATGYSLLIQSD